MEQTVEAIQHSGHSDITGIAVVVVAALLGGLGMERLKQPAILGYMVAGVLLGPSALGLVKDQGQIGVLAELGVLMLLFVIGMELSLRVFKRIWRLTAAAAGLQIVASTGVFMLMTTVFGWPVPMAVLLGFVVAMSSTAVAIKILQDSGELKTRSGRIAVGVLISQDLAVVPMMLIIGVLGAGGFDWVSVLRILGSVGLLGALVWYLGGRRSVELPIPELNGKKREELGPLMAITFCFGAAAISGLLGVSAAYGAFVAGLVIGNSNLKKTLSSEVRPIQSILMMVFFLSIGLLIDLNYIWANLGAVLIILFMVTVFKTVLNVAIFRALGQAWPVAVVSGIVLAQIGEFSFLLAGVGVASGVIPPETSRLVIAVTVLSLLMSPIWTITARRLHAVAADGMDTIGDVWQIAWGRETHLVAGGLNRAGRQTMGLGRRLATAVGEVRARRRQKTQSGDELNSSDDNRVPPALPNDLPDECLGDPQDDPKDDRRA